MLGFRSIARVLGVINEHFIEFKVPHYTTIRTWVYRMGLYELKKPIEQASDWIWICDETIGIGSLRCLAIIGVRSSQKANDLTLEHKDMQLLGLLPSPGLKGEAIAQEFKEVEKRTGKPLEIIIDGGANLKKGAKDYSKGTHVCIIQDVVHKVALMLEKTLKADQRWNGFLEKMAETKRKVKQTRLCSLMPPTLRSKARYMGADRIVKWGLQVEEIVERESHDSYLQKYFGWIKEFRVALANWRQILSFAGDVKHIIRQQGFCKGSYQEVQNALSSQQDDFTSKLLQCVTEETNKVEGRRLIGSSEVIESIFGKYKEINKANNQGITTNILGMGVFIGQKDEEKVQEAMNHCSIQDLLDWKKEIADLTVASAKRKFFRKNRNKNCEKIPVEAVA